MTRKPTIVPVEPGTVLRLYPERDTDNWFTNGWTWVGKRISFVGNPVFEVKSYVLNKDGGHVTFEHSSGTFVIFGGGRIEDIKFPYPHPMFEVVGDAESERIKAQWRTEAAALRERRRWTWPDWLRLGTAKVVQV